MKKQHLFLAVLSLFLHPFLHCNAQTGTLSNQVVTLVDSADRYRNNGQIQQSIRLLQQGFELSKSRSDSLQAIVSHKLAVNYFYTDSFPKALQMVGQAIDIRKNILPEGHVDIANSHYLRALIYRYSGQPTKGIDDLEAAVQQIESNNVLEAPEKASRLSSYYSEWGILLAMRGDYYQALFCWDQAEKNDRVYLSGEVLIARIAYLSELRGTVAHDLGQYERAVKAYEQALDWQEQQVTPSLSALASLYNNLGLTYQERGQQDRALLLFEKALNLFQNKEDRSGMLNVYPNLIKAMAARQDYQGARQNLDKALVLCEQVYGTTYHPLAAKLRYYFAESLLEGGQEEAFKNQLQQALHLLSPDCAATDWQDLPDVSDGRTANQNDLVLPLYLKAHYLYKKGIQQPGQKIQLLQQALQAFDALDRLISQSRQSFRVAASKFYLQQLWLKAYEQATLSCLELFTATGDNSFLTRAFQFANKNKAIILLEGIKNLKSKELGGIPDSLLQKEAALLQAYYETETDWYESAAQKDQAQNQQLKNQLLDLQAQLDQLSNKMEEAYPRYYELKYQPLEPTDPKKLQAQLDDKSLMVEFFVGRDHIFIFFLTKNKLSFKKIDKPAAFVQSIETFRYLSAKFGLLPQEQAQLDELGYQLFDWLLREDLAAFPATLTHLIIVPDDILLALSFEALNTEKGNQRYLLEKYPISYLYASQLLQRPIDQQRIRWSQKRFLGFGLEYDEDLLNLLKGVDTLGNRRSINIQLRNLGQLEYSDDEVLAIQQLLKGKAFVNVDATKSNFMNNLEDYNILHLAMHGLLDLENPLRSALVFAPDRDQKDDYLLYASDIYNLQLPDNRMVMLSACNTGFGKLYSGEGIRSLSRAFMYAGAPSVVASLWGAPDQSTKDITVAYYKNLKKGLRKSEALQKAKIAFLEKASPTYRHPAYWAHLIVIGEDEALFSKSSRLFWPILIGLALILFFIGRRISRQ